MRLEVTDDSGFLALIDPDAYSGFVASNWNLEQLLHRFGREMTERRLLIWGTGQEGCWTVGVSLEPTVLTGVREVRGSIISTKGRLCVTNYESLTMAAQFSDITLPEDYQADLVVTVAPGSYVCRVVHTAAAAHNWEKTMPPEFQLELTPALALEPVWERIPWAEEHLYEHL